jgi:hypothetical protein
MTSEAAAQPKLEGRGKKEETCCASGPRPAMRYYAHTATDEHGKIIREIRGQGIELDRLFRCHEAKPIIA